MATKKENQQEELITRKEALKKMGTYSKYAAVTALGTYIMLNPKKSQAQSPATPGTGFREAVLFDELNKN